MTLSIVILAAGQGKRMNSALPKVLQPLAGRPLLGHVLVAARALEPAAVHVVYGHGGEQVPAALAADLAIVAPRSSWVLQAEQKGTGHAMQQALPVLHDDEIVLVLYGDVPLVQPETLRALVALAGPKSLGLLTVELPDPTGYGRIVRDVRGKVLRIVEQKDANARERKIREGNTGIMAVPVKRLRAWLSKLRNANAQGEYYLTDIIAMAVKDKIKVAPLAAPTVAEVLGINDKVQLAEAEDALQRSRARALMVAGATLADASRVDVRGEIVRLHKSFAVAVQGKHYPDPVAMLLGQFLAASALLSTTIKFDGRLVLQVRSQGEVALMMAECTSDGELRGIARYAETPAGHEFRELLRDGTLVITIDTRKGEPYQGIVSL
jgi:bifunctional UDP-N-acetylglucosamine pyrophosphorylase/glucosamine-1-phosphate N-acetyltransferase